jgi:AAA domain
VLCEVGRELPAEAAGTVGPAELEVLADRFLAERAVSVVSEHAIGERHYATPELLEVERRLIDAAVSRTDEQTGTCSHDTLRETLAAHPTVGADQAAMVRAITQGGQGVSVVVGKAGTGKTYALGVARHAWQLEGYRVLGAAPTGIATVCLDAEGFEHSRTVDSLLVELDRECADRERRGGAAAPLNRQALGRDRGQDGQDEGVLDERTVLVVDEAAMLGSRKLGRLLDYAAEARTKVVLVGDDKQLASIEAGGGFRGLRLRLGASTLTENRRQAEPWEREAVEHLRDGNIDAALSAYREHDRLVAVETPGQLKETMLADWWRSFQQGNRVVILAYRRDEVDQFNTACQQLRDAEGQLGPVRLTVRDRSFAVGDQVVCGKNALQSLGAANASRGQVVALDTEQRAMTLKLEDSKTVTLPREYLDERPAWWLRGNPERRTVDLAYATTGHKAQGITRDEALVRVTGAEDRQWLYVGESRAIGRTRYYSVVTPEPAVRDDPEQDALDVPAADRTPRDQADQLAAAARRDGGKRLATDTANRLDLRSMSKHDLRARRDQLAALLEAGPRDRSRLLALATTKREQSEERLAEATGRLEQASDLVAGLEHGPARWLRRATSYGHVSSPSRQRRPTRSPGRRPTVPPTANAPPATSSSSTRRTRRSTRSWWPSIRWWCARTSGAPAPRRARSNWSGRDGRVSWANGRPASRVVAPGIGRWSRRLSTGSAGTSMMPSARSAPGRTVRMPRLRSGAPGSTPSRRLVACATWRATGPSAATARRRPVAATSAAVIGASVSDQTTANVTTTTSAPCSDGLRGDEAEACQRVRQGVLRRAQGDRRAGLRPAQGAAGCPAVPQPPIGQL